MTSKNESVLPVEYGDTKISLLPKDPLWMFVYWEISQTSKNHFLNTFKENLIPSSLALRVYDVTDIIFNGTNANNFFDIRISDRPDCWYINVGEFNRAWCVDLGYILKDGSFITITRSNIVRLPRYGISDLEDSVWASYHIFDKTLFELISKSSTNFMKIEREACSEHTEWKGDGFDFSSLLTHMPSSMPSSRISSTSFIGSFSQKTKTEKIFWLKADTEITVYGATEAGSTLTIQGKEIKLAEDGSFSSKFYLPEGEDEYFIEAISSDGKMSKRVFFIINKQTN
jgi:hypothetical protein